MGENMQGTCYLCFKFENKFKYRNQEKSNTYQVLTSMVVCMRSLYRSTLLVPQQITLSTSGIVTLLSAAFVAITIFIWSAGVGAKAKSCVSWGMFECTASTTVLGESVVFV